MREQPAAAARILLRPRGVLRLAASAGAGGAALPLIALPWFLLLAHGCVSLDAVDPPPAGGEAGGGGGGGGADCPDLSASGACTAQLAGACPDLEVCTVAPGRSCGAERCCTLALACRPPTGLAPGGYRCEVDEDCASGVCLPLADGGLCLRPCRLTPTGSSCPDELDCIPVPLTGAASVRACAGTEDGVLTAARSLCRRDRDCAGGRYCRIFGGSRFFEGGAHGVCVPGSRGAEAGLLCERDGPWGEPLRAPDDASELCPESGLCHAACSDFDNDLCNCGLERDEVECRGARCSRPCGADAECPAPFVCRAPSLFTMPGAEPDLAFNLCLLPDAIRTDWGCFDETDCCKGGLQRSGRRCCQGAGGERCEQDTLSETTHCRVELQGPRFLSVCREPSGLSGLGAPCAAGGDCESGLCAPDGSCASPCLVGSDRCAELLPGSSCCPTPAGEACVPACRLDCAAGPSCP